MGIFPGFGVWMNQNNQQPPEAESKRSKNVKFESAEEEKEETKKQLKLWRASEKQYEWHDYPPRVKVTKTEKGETHLKMEFTIGLPPEAVFDIISSHDNQTYSYFSIMKRRKILHTSTKEVLSDNGPKEKLVLMKYYTSWKFLWWSGTIPVELTFNESRDDFSILYTISDKNVMYMKTFTGKLRVEPLYVYNDKYCKPRLPKSREEYKRCTGGKGLVASTVYLDQIFEPIFPLNLPPVSWYIRRLTVKNTKHLMEDLQIRGAVLRSV